MGRRQKLWAKKEREKLRNILGDKCKRCGKTKDELELPLEFDCIVPTGDKHHRMDTSAATCYYRLQLALDNLQLLCEKCHNKKSVGEHPNQQQEENEPF